jgi:hypothetical protein
MTPAEFWLMAGYLNVEAEDRKHAMEEARQEAEDRANARSGKSTMRIRGEGLKRKQKAEGR